MCLPQPGAPFFGQPGDPGIAYWFKYFPEYEV
jgi:hypothetical protein